jgi:hypothetical protein
MPVSLNQPARKLFDDTFAIMDAGGKAKDPNFDVMSGCPGMVWWDGVLAEAKLTVAEFIDRVVSGLKSGTVRSSWVATFIRLHSDNLVPEFRIATLPYLTPSDCALLVADRAATWTADEKTILKPKLALIEHQDAEGAALIGVIRDG